jgi:putative membrane protein
MPAVQPFLIKVLINAVAIWVAAAIVPGVTVTDGGLLENVLTLAAVGAIFGVVNAVIKPIVKILSLPLYIVTLGLMAFVVNALMLVLVSWLSGVLGIGFSIDDFFWSAIGAAVVVSLVSLVLHVVLPDGKD